MFGVGLFSFSFFSSSFLFFLSGFFFPPSSTDYRRRKGRTGKRTSEGETSASGEKSVPALQPGALGEGRGLTKRVSNHHGILLFDFLGP